MKNRGIYLALGFFAAASLVYYVTGGGKPVAVVPTPSPQASPVVRISSAQVRSVAVRGKGKVLTVTRAGSGWTYSLCPQGQDTCPTSAADPAKAGVLVDTIVGLRPSKTFPGLINGLPAYGLDKATNGEVDIETTAGARVVLLIGAKAPDQVSQYLRLQDSNDVSAVAASTIDTQILSALDTPPAPPPSPSPQPTPSAAPAGPALPAPSPSA